MKEIFTEDEWNSIAAESNEQPVLFMKHSATCPVSAAAYSELQHADQQLPVYYLVVQTSRPLSQHIEKTTQIRHESPQLFLLQGGKAVWNASHHAISSPAIEQAVKQHTD